MQVPCLYERYADLTGGPGISMELALSAHVNAPQRLNEATVLLLGTVTGVPLPCLSTVELRPRDHNWLHAPWYGDAPGGALVLGDRIYLSRTLFHAPWGRDTTLHLQWLLLLAHEVVHVHQAARAQRGRMRFGLWATGRYVLSFLRHGVNAHDRAPFEVEAERGRQQLAALFKRTGGIHGAHPVLQLARTNDVEGMRRWLQQVGAYS